MLKKWRLLGQCRNSIAPLRPGTDKLGVFSQLSYSKFSLKGVATGGRKGRYKRPVSSAVRHIWTIITNLKRVPLQLHITL